MIYIGDVTQLFGDVWTRRLTFSAGHFIAGNKKKVIVRIMRNSWTHLGPVYMEVGDPR